MKKPMQPRLVWRLRSGEALLRDVAVVTNTRDEGEGRSPVNRIGWAVAAFLLAMLSLASRGPEMWSGIWRAEQIMSLVVILLLLAFVGWLLFRGSPTTHWGDMHNFVFTDQRISLLDEQGRVMDEIARDEITEAQVTPLSPGEKSVDCFRPNDPDLEHMFSILYVDDPEGVFDFVKSTYL
ncbi:hypothetical protein [Maricaulis maris]|uniref:hypothetical protein n=1 Tax=Maricaulis maris TaxID=74318 RepID=UPI003B8E7FCE